MRINKLSSLIGLSAVLVLGPVTAVQANSPGIYLGASWGAYSKVDPMVKTVFSRV